MTDEINDPIAALRTELASVAPSPGFADRVRERLADELEPLRAELTDLAVSSDFAVRVRQTIEAGGSRRGFSWSPFNWRLVVPAAGLAAAALAALVYLRPAETPAPAQIAGSSAVTPIVETPGVEPVAPAPQSRPEVARVAGLTTREPAPVREPRDPMLEVITDQPAILRALWIRVEPGVSVDSTEPVATYQAPKLEVAPIEVSPISKFVVPDTRAPIGVTPIILRFRSVGTPAPHLVTAESAERSSR
jgi:hypothetical protein